MKLITFPAHAVLILEERLREREEQDGLEPPAGMDRTELALRILILAELLALPSTKATAKQ